MNSIRLACISQCARPTSESDARRIAIIAADEFLTINGYDFINAAYWFEQAVYQSAKKLNLTCEPSEEELRIIHTQKELRRRRISHKEINPLKLMSEALTREEWKGELIDIQPGGGRESKKSERVHNRGGPCKLSRDESENPLSIKKRERPAISEGRAKNRLSRTIGRSLVN